MVVTATAAYTYSRTIDNSSEIFSTLAGGNTSAFAQNPLDTNLGERAVSGISFPNVASIGMVYAIPKFGPSNSLVSKLVNGWQLNTIWIYNSGQPFTDFDFSQNQSKFANLETIRRVLTALPALTRPKPLTADTILLVRSYPTQRHL